jgi:hypothetical protein
MILISLRGFQYDSFKKQAHNDKRLGMRPGLILIENSTLKHPSGQRKLTVNNRVWDITVARPD